MLQSRPRTQRLVIYFAALVVLAFLAVFVVVPAAAAWRMTYASGTTISPDAGSVLSAETDDMALISGAAFILHGCCEHSVTSEAEDVLRFTVKTDDQKVRGSLRSELRFKSSGYDVPTRYTARIRPQAEWPDTDEFVIPMQWHAQRDMWLGEPGRFPPLEVAIEDGRWIVKKAYDTSRFTMPGDKTVTRETLAEVPFEPGEWTDWRIEARWAADQSGTLDIWKDGEQIVSDRGPNAYVDAVGPYWKLGTYRPQQAKRGTQAEPISIDFADIALSVDGNR